MKYRVYYMSAGNSGVTTAEVMYGILHMIVNGKQVQAPMMAPDTEEGVKRTLLHYGDQIFDEPWGIIYVLRA